eukprot:GHVS01021494.1.p1 GENE.GHVS01021494.1~~GHVS01021494.1.p1  ORF type:complete len:355 (-),score=58.96 GHVS01021494.1:568-1524(-)
MSLSMSFPLFLFPLVFLLSLSCFLVCYASPAHSPVLPDSQKWTCHLSDELSAAGPHSGACKHPSDDNVFGSSEKKQVRQELNLSLSSIPSSSCVNHHIHYPPQSSPPPAHSVTPSLFNNLTLVGRTAPSVEAEMVTENNEFEKMRLSDYRGKKNVLLLFYPSDFTYVCPSELLAFNSALPSFRKRDVQIFGISVDSKFSHAAWRQQPLNSGGIGEIGFPLISDISKEISRSYGVLTVDGSVSLRGLFLIDRQGLVQHQLVNNLPLGRSVDEALRVVDAMQHTEQHDEVCPANWKKGLPAMTPTQKGVRQYLSEHKDTI